MEKENQLAVIVKESNLEPTKAKFILDKFTEYFDMADEWIIKARAIVVTKPDQKAEMQMARTGRLFLREKRIAVEAARKELKEQALREGKAIDGIANVLKALIVPIEEYLERQEKFVEIQEEAKRESMRLEIEKRIEDERIAKEKADAEALVKANIENERLKAEAIEREKEAKAEREKQEAVLAKERAKAEADRKEQEKKLAAERAKAEVERKAIEDMARAERDKREYALALERAKVEKEKEAAENKAKAEKEKERAKTEAERQEKERLAEILKAQIECPKCHHKFSLKKEI
jgi:hypothetical protein